jgi:hypothetical protein
VLRLTELFWAEQQGAFIGTAFATHVLELNRSAVWHRVVTKLLNNRGQSAATQRRERIPAIASWSALHPDSQRASTGLTERFE